MLHPDVSIKSSFDYCSKLNDIRYEINEDLNSYMKKGHEELTINGQEIKEIKYFLNGQEITSLNIPSSITQLGPFAFQKCKSITSVYVNWDTPTSCKDAKRFFTGADINNCTLYVPRGTYQDYWFAYVWGDFGNIVEYDATGVDKITTSSDAKEVSRYSVNGQRLAAPTKGLNIVKYSDGSIKKLTVQ